MQQAIVFSHANGFPAESYSYFFEQFPSIPITYVPVLGDQTDSPIRNWKMLVPEIIRHIETNHQAPVIGVGHSLGAVLTYWAALERPDLFSRIILLEPPIFAGPKRLLLFLLRITRLAPYWNPVARKALNRKKRFQDREEAHAYWAPKGLFQPFHPRCFADYVQHGLKADDTGLTLAFPAEREYRVFLSPPFSLGANTLNLPSHLLYSSSHQVLSPTDIQALQGYFKHTRFESIGGGHMFPLEFPVETALRIQHILKNPEA